MYKELQSDIDGFKHPGHGTLTGWAKQGNTSDHNLMIIFIETLISSWSSSRISEIIQFSLLNYT